MQPKNIGNQHRDILYGIVLGDGSLNKQDVRGKNAMLDIAHTPIQLEYLEWKASILRDSGFNVRINFKSPTVNSNYPKYPLLTNNHRYWSEMRAELYTFRNTAGRMRKRITENILEKCSLRKNHYKSVCFINYNLPPLSHITINNNETIILLDQIAILTMFLTVQDTKAKPSILI